MVDKKLVWNKLLLTLESSVIFHLVSAFLAVCCPFRDKVKFTLRKILITFSQNPALWWLLITLHKVEFISWNIDSSHIFIFSSLLIFLKITSHVMGHTRRVTINRPSTKHLPVSDETCLILVTRFLGNKWWIAKKPNKIGNCNAFWVTRFQHIYSDRILHSNCIYYFHCVFNL